MQDGRLTRHRAACSCVHPHPSTSSLPATAPRGPRTGAWALCRPPPLPRLELWVSLSTFLRGGQHPSISCPDPVPWQQQGNLGAERGLALPEGRGPQTGLPDQRGAGVLLVALAWPSRLPAICLSTR